MTVLMTKRLIGFGLKSLFLSLLLLPNLSTLKAAIYIVNTDSDWSTATAFTATPTAADDIIVTASATLTIDVADAVCASMQIGISGNGNAGTISFNAGSQLTVSGLISLGGTVNNDNTGTITMTAGGTLVCGSLTFNLGLNNTANVINQGAGSSITVNGMVLLNQPGSNNETYTWNVGEGTATVSGLINFLGTSSMNRIAQIVIGAGTMNANGGISFVGVTAANQVINIGSGTLNIGGSGIAISTAGTLTTTAGTVDYNESVVAQIVGAYSYNNLILSGALNKTITGATVTGTLSLQGTATPIGTSPTYAAGATLEYAGSAAQTTSNVEFNSAGVPTNLTLNNANGVTLHAARSISGTLSLTAGNLITTAANLLTLGSAAVVVGGSKDSFIDGPIAKEGNNLFLFPTGNLGIYAPIGISPPSVATDVFQAEYVRATPPDRLDIETGNGIDHISSLEYWNLNRTTGTSSVTVGLSWRASSDVTDPTSIVVARYNGDEWENEGRSATTGTAALGGLTSNLVSDFSPFTLASTSGGASNPLPVELLSFTAQKKSKGVLLEWETATEVNNAFFQIERSFNGKAFEAISKVEGVGNSDITQSYQWLDETPRSGINYYRLKQVDFDGAFEYHPIVSVDMGPIKEASLQLFPNPSIDKVTVILPSEVEGEADLVIYNALGQLVKTTTIDLVKGNNNTELDIQDLAKGRYTMVVNYGGQRLTQAPLMIQR